MTTKSYYGRLYYDDSDDFVEITSFIIREGEIGFSLTSATAEFGRWAATGTAKLGSDDIYRVSGLYASNMGAPCSEPWDISFRIVASDASLLSVEGEIDEGSEVSHFEGELEPSR